MTKKHNFMSKISKGVSRAAVRIQAFFNGNRRRWYGLALLLVVLMVAASWLLYPWGQVVSIGMVTSQPLEMRAPANGVVRSVYQQRGEQVEAGTPLLELADPALNAQILAVERQLSQMQQFRDQGAEISAQMTNKITVAQEGVQRQTELLAQFEALRKKGVIPTAEVAAVMQANTAAKVALEQARAELILEQQHQQESRQAGVVTQRRQQLELELARLKALREQLIIRAPYTARVVDVLVQTGEQLEMGWPMLWLSGSGSPLVLAYLDPKYLDLVDSGREVSILWPNGDKIPARVEGLPELVSRLPEPMMFDTDSHKPRLQVTVVPLQPLPMAVEGLAVEVSFGRI